MHVLDLQLATPILAQQHTFYAEVLGLPVLRTTPDSVTFQVGTSRLSFTEAKQPLPGIYHFAFTIPENQIDVATDWLRQRVPLLADSSGTNLFYSENWNAHNVYFYDPAGNVLELIARHELSDASELPFSATSLLNISEIGIAAENVPEQIAAIQAEVDAPVYRGPGSDTFSSIGDAHGLFIVVQRGRIWYPDTGKPAEHLPITVIIDDGSHPTACLRFS